MDHTFVQEINGRSMEAGDLPLMMALSYGHFTSMQIRNRQVKGLRLHLERLRKSSDKLFGCHLPDDKIMAYMRNIIGENESCTIRINIFTPDYQRPGIYENDLYVLITKKPPVQPAAAPLQVMTARFQRLMPDVKYSGILSGILAYQREARAAGYDDVLYVNQHQHISEGSVWNIGFYDGHSVILPAAPALPGIMIQLLTEGLWNTGVPVIHRNISLSQLNEYKAAFYTNSINHRGIITRINQHQFDKDPSALSSLLDRTYDAIPWDQL
ncbi:aminotransferase class IV [Chitinophaga sp. HK235]|uniref:aminotransferase class IV n=1 Tax=Chitinophaga sp. HK235 TaxID=2952571 RepID=UPI001BA977A6|nr:aminotransferase class IV [Chitinophaga sp. HK235]